MLEPMKPWLRAVKYGYLRRRAQRMARKAGPDDRVPASVPVAFLFGCGRSGTTILGRIMSRHPHVCYLREPGYMWAAINRETDYSNFYDRVEGRCIMDASHADAQSRVRFGRLLLSARRRSGRRLLLEKTPINAMRIGYLDALVPHAKYVHIVRDGVDVSRSIGRIAVANTYRVTGKRGHNQWWGVDGIKWDTLARDGAAAGYFAHEVDRLQDDQVRGAYEWLVTHGEVDRWRKVLGDRLLDVLYPSLTADPESELRRLCAFLDLDAPEAWLEQARQMIGPARQNEGDAVTLPPSMCAAFNAYQERFGFANRAVPAGATE
jgi:hypothetical protein